MNNGMIRGKRVFLLALAILFLFGSAGCGSQTATMSDTAVIDPQPGSWTVAFTVDKDSGEAENWVLQFGVSDDGKTVSFMQFMHYKGELTSGTNVFLTAIKAPIENNSFDFSLFEHISGSQHDYIGHVEFTSSTEAQGTLNIDGADHPFTAAWSPRE